MGDLLVAVVEEAFSVEDSNLLKVVVLVASVLEDRAFSKVAVLEDSTVLEAVALED